jgi:5-methylthioadenosine/S-adenosylhomocysteine deaminase
MFQSLGRTLGEGLNGWEWLSRFMWPYAAEITPAETLAAVYLGAVEAVLAGTTSVLDHHYGRTDAATTLVVAAALEEVGLRGKVARGIAGPYTELARRQGLPESAFPHPAGEELAITEACMKARPGGSKVEIWPGPINAVYTDQDLLVAAVEMARSHGVGWHTHLSAPRSDPDAYVEAYGMRPAAWLHSRGLLGPDAVLAHATWVDEEEIEAIGSTGTAVAHCPLSNQYMPYGVMPLRRLLEAGATVGLGSDGSACGHRQDLFENMKLLVLMHRLHSLDPAGSSAPEALEIATRGGAAVHRIEAGVLAPGALADVIVVEASRPHLVPLHRPGPGIVYSARAGDVETNIIGGEIVVERGRCTRVDQDAVIEEARARAGELMERIGSAGPADG